MAWDHGVQVMGCASGYVFTPREQVLDLRWVQRSPVTAPSSRRCEEGDGADPGDDRAAPATPHLATLLLCGEFRCYRWPTRNDCMNQSCQQVESRGSIYSTFERLQYWQYSLLFLFHFLLSRSVLFSGSTPPHPTYATTHITGRRHLRATTNTSTSSGTSERHNAHSFKYAGICTSYWGEDRMQTNRATRSPRQVWV